MESFGANDTVPEGFAVESPNKLADDEEEAIIDRKKVEEGEGEERKTRRNGGSKERLIPYCFSIKKCTR
jgi:hypothetical protein